MPTPILRANTFHWDSLLVKISRSSKFKTPKAHHEFRAPNKYNSIDVILGEKETSQILRIFNDLKANNNGREREFEVVANIRCGEIPPKEQQLGANN